jgi:mono/diheme cytochrome c family protein
MSRWADALALGLALALAAAGCRQDMHDLPSYTALEPSDFFAEGTSARTPVAGTVARGQLRDDPHLYAGRTGPSLPEHAPSYADTFPFPIDAAALDRGQQRYDVFCAVCHDRLGTGRGMIVRRGFKQPPTLHVERLRAAPVGYLFDVITNGFGAMPDYRGQIPVDDRWKIIAYVRALQLSQHATPDDAPAEHRVELLRAAGGR